MSNIVSSTLSLVNGNAPVTPQRRQRRTAPANLVTKRDSPFSDYFTDEARSIDDALPLDTPSADAQDLLLRLNTFGANIVRQGPGRDTVNALNARLDAMEETFSTPSTHRRRPNRMLDSGFIDGDEEEEAPNTPSTRGGAVQSALPLSLDGTLDLIDQKKNVAKLQLQDHLLQEATQLLKRVTKANAELKKRFETMRDMNDMQSMQIEEVSQENLTLTSQVDALKADLGFDHSELLFLKLQFKALEVDVNALADKQDSSAPLQKRRVLLQDGLERLQDDWSDVDARLRRRRLGHRVVSSTPVKLSGLREDGKKADEEGDWSLDVSKKRQGRFHSITIKRTESGRFDRPADDNDTTVIDHSKAVYHEQGTQTDQIVDAQMDAYADTVDNVAADDETDNEAEQPLRKTPWQDLWDSLSAFAGMDKD